MARSGLSFKESAVAGSEQTLLAFPNTWVPFSFQAGEQPTSLQINSSSARLLHSGIRYVGLTSFVAGFNCSIMRPAAFSCWP
jgi:hypothetical protein